MPLAIRRASLRSAAFRTARTGPKISSWAMRAIWARRRRRSCGRRSSRGWQASPGSAWNDDSALGRGDSLIFENAAAGLGVDHRADDRLGIFGRADFDGARRLDQPGEEGVVSSRRERSTREQAEHFWPA